MVSFIHINSDTDDTFKEADNSENDGSIEEIAYFTKSLTAQHIQFSAISVEYPPTDPEGYAIIYNFIESENYSHVQDKDNNQIQKTMRDKARVVFHNQAHLSANQVNTWKQKETIQLCFNELENSKYSDNSSFTWRLAVLEQVFPDETTKNNIAFASVCIDVICDANYSRYELQQKYIIQKMNSSLREMESSELEIELKANEASTSNLEGEKE
ncbi:11285_t:CDS:2 [Dentiscutata erythropus]|uniref:11285_t:CDS:1 n=1 Tax=Dentiscutata erythropus TaxID=1348616 RepID=A0A9N9NHW8_9GLOM|nr:11285_t:CDS:2 [Dentiscutata erythropus]